MASSNGGKKGAQDYLATLGMRERQFKSLGTTNANCDTYRDKLCGDTPEFMPLDNNLFADFERALVNNVCVTRHLDPADPSRFSLADPKVLFKSFQRTWETHPTSERIVQDIRRFRDSLHEVVLLTSQHRSHTFTLFLQIIRSEGVAVNWSKLRHSRRLQRHRTLTQQETRHVKLTRSVKKAEKEKMPLHPDARTAWEEFLLT